MSESNRFFVVRAVEPDHLGDHQCYGCGELCGTTFCGECCALRQSEAEQTEAALTAALEIAREAHNARWDDDTTAWRRKLADHLRKEMAVAFRLATGDVL